MGQTDAIYGEFVFKEEALHHLEKATQKRLLGSRKLSLVLDLDETLLNTAKRPNIGRAKELTADVHHEMPQIMYAQANSPQPMALLQPSDFRELRSYPDHFTKMCALALSPLLVLAVLMRVPRSLLMFGAHSTAGAPVRCTS